MVWALQILPGLALCALGVCCIICPLLPAILGASCFCTPYISTAELSTRGAVLADRTSLAGPCCCSCCLRHSKSMKPGCGVCQPAAALVLSHRHTWQVSWASSSLTQRHAVHRTRPGQEAPIAATTRGVQDQHMPVFTTSGCVRTFLQVPVPAYPCSNCLMLSL